MKFAAGLFVLLLVVAPVIGATVSNSFTVQAVGAVHRTLETTWNAGMDNETIGGSSGSSVVTAIGDTRYQSFDNLDARTGNYYNQTGYLEFTVGGLFEETVAMDNSDPWQSVSVSHAGILQKAQVDTAKYVDGADLSMGQQAAWDGAGMYTRKVSYDVAQERETQGHKYTFTSSSRDVATVFTNATGGAIVRPEFDFIDFSDSFIVNDTALSVNATNTTDVVSEHTGVM